MRVSLLALFFLLGVPAYAQGLWLEYRSGSQLPAMEWNSPTQPTVAATSTVLPFKPRADDRDPQHYWLVNGAIVYTPPPPRSPPPPMPDAPKFLAAVNSDALTTASSCALVFQMAGLLAIFQADFAASDMIALQTHWKAAVTTFGSTWLTQDVQTMLLEYADQYNIPLRAK